MHIITNSGNQTFNLAIADCPQLVAPKNHLDLMRQLLGFADDVLIVSPFLFDEFDLLFDDLDVKTKKFELITTLAPRGDDQFRKPSSIRNFGEKVKSTTGAWPNIGIDQSLHSKVYIFSKAGAPIAGIVTSANLTFSGLTRNHETGTVIADPDLIRRLGAEVRRGLDFVHLTEYQVSQLCAVVESVASMRNWSRDVTRDDEIGISNILMSLCTPSEGNRGVKIKPGAAYYVKVSGVSDHPILPTARQAFDEPHSDLWFAKAPANLRLGDCLLEVAVGGQCFLSYYACASAVFERTPEERRNDPEMARWPFYVFANNLSLHYGKRWFDQPIYYAPLIEEFKKQHPSAHVTKSGSDDLRGAIQWGHSYISVTEEFGQFVKSKIDAFSL